MADLLCSNDPGSVLRSLLGWHYPRTESGILIVAQAGSRGGYNPTTGRYSLLTFGAACPLGAQSRLPAARAPRRRPVARSRPGRRAGYRGSRAAPGAGSRWAVGRSRARAGPAAHSHREHPQAEHTRPDTGPAGCTRPAAGRSRAAGRVGYSHRAAGRVGYSHWVQGARHTDWGAARRRGRAAASRRDRARAAPAPRPRAL